MTAPLPTFTVDKKGLAKLLERRGKEFAVTELIQNAWDEDTTRVEVTLQPADESGGGYFHLQVEDDNPEGFKDLTHAYTLFAESLKKGDAEKRGRFNLGEKLVIALCESARIETTTGTVIFTEHGRYEEAAARGRGSRFSGLLRLTQEEADRVIQVVHTLLPPPGITTVFNGVTIPAREPVAAFDVSLRTERADADGNLRPTTRKTTVRVYEPIPGETPSLYEMGIPVVETGDRWHVDIGQKVPINMDRDNVPPGYLRDVRAAVLNHTAHLLSQEDARAKWVDAALEDEAVEPGAVRKVVTQRFGEKAVIADPTDREAERIAVSKGYTVIPGGALSKDAWKNVRASEAAKPAGQVTPSPNPAAGDKLVNEMDPAHWTAGIRERVEFAKRLAAACRPEVELDVRIANGPQWPFAATWERRGEARATLTLNLGRLGFRWFDRPHTDSAVLSLLIHEMAHHPNGAEHLTEKFYDECCRMGAAAVNFALAEGRDAFSKEVG